MGETNKYTVSEAKFQGHGLSVESELSMINDPENPSKIPSVPFSSTISLPSCTSPADQYGTSSWQSLSENLPEYKSSIFFLSAESASKLCHWKESRESLLNLSQASVSLLAKTEMMVPTLQDYFEDGVREWMRNTSSVPGPQNEPVPFSRDPVYSDG